MKNDEIIIKISNKNNVYDAVCKAMNLKKFNVKEKSLHQTIKPSQSQDKLGVNTGLDYKVEGHSSVI